MTSGVPGKAHLPSSHPGNFLHRRSGGVGCLLVICLFCLGFFCPAIKHCRELGSEYEKVLALLPPISLPLLVSPYINNGPLLRRRKVQWLTVLVKKRKIKGEKSQKFTIINLYFLGGKLLIYHDLGSWLQGVTHIYPLTSSYYCQFFFSWQHRDCNTVWETTSPHVKLKSLKCFILRCSFTQVRL